MRLGLHGAGKVRRKALTPVGAVILRETVYEFMDAAETIRKIP
jgi:hypothetical protein